MTEKEQHIDHLISGSVFGTLTDEEKATLDAWKNQSETNAHELEAYNALWTKSKRMVLSDSIDVESALSKTKKQMLIPEKKNKRWLYVLSQAAAVLILAVAISALYHYFTSSSVPSDIFQEVTTAYGTQTSIVLADGTKVRLNSGSHLRFPLSFDEMNERRIELEGEAFFEVTKNKEKPFIVNTNEWNVTVLGTSFNVAAYNDSPNLTVALVEGKVSLSRSNTESNTELVALNPNEVAIFDREKKEMFISKEKFLDQYTAWQEGRIVFFGDPLETVVHRLEKWYNVEIEVIDSQLFKSKITGTFIDESLEQVLSSLSISSPINYSIVPSKLNDDGSYSRRKIKLTERTK